MLIFFYKDYMESFYGKEEAIAFTIFQNHMMKLRCQREEVISSSSDFKFTQPFLQKNSINGVQWEQSNERRKKMTISTALMAVSIVTCAAAKLYDLFKKSNDKK